MKRQFIGDCRDEELVEQIFGSVSEFARQVQLNGNNFLYVSINGGIGKIEVKYNSKRDRHQFYFQN